MNETISRSIFKFDEQKEKLQSDYYRLLQEESGLDEKKYILIQWFEEINVFLVCELYINISQETNCFLFTAEANGPSCALIVIAWGLNALAYTLFLLTFPITYWLFVHRYLLLSLPFVIAFVFVFV